MSVDSTSDSSNEVGGQQARNRGLRLVVSVIAAVVVAGLVIALAIRDSGRSGNSGIDENVTKLGNIEVTAKLTEIRGKFLPNDGFYNYAFVMMYEIVEVHRGQIDRKLIAVAHYNPLKPRSNVADEFYPNIGGTLKKFRAEEIHRMALEVPIDDHYIGGIVDRYFKEDKGDIYWPVWTNLAN